MKHMIERRAFLSLLGGAAAASQDHHRAAVIALTVFAGAWSYASIRADASAIAAGVFTPTGIDVMQLMRDAKPMPQEQFAAF
jgi:hypothetical protein